MRDIDVSFVFDSLKKDEVPDEIPKQCFKKKFGWRIGNLYGCHVLSLVLRLLSVWRILSRCDFLIVVYYNAKRVLGIMRKIRQIDPVLGVDMKQCTNWFSLRKQNQNYRCRERRWGFILWVINFIIIAWSPASKRVDLHVDITCCLEAALQQRENSDCSWNAPYLGKRDGTNTMIIVLSEEIRMNARWCSLENSAGIFQSCEEKQKENPTHTEWLMSDRGLCDYIVINHRHLAIEGDVDEWLVNPNQCWFHKILCFVLAAWSRVLLLIWVHFRWKSLRASLYHNMLVKIRVNRTLWSSVNRYLMIKEITWKV